jgi:DNA polymerase-3 subunit gamma/tau
MEYNMANTRGIDTIREIITQSVFSPMSGTVKIYLIDECHKLTGDAQNSLLKILEETPDHIRFILCTTEPEKLLTTIKNRCTPFQVQPLVTPKLVALLKDINAKEGLNIQFPSLKEIAKVAMGSPRHALVLLEQVSNLDDKSEENVKRVVTSGLIDEAKTIELCRALLKKDWPEVAGLLKGITAEPEQVRYAVLGYFSTVLLSRGDQGVAKTMSVFTDSFMYSGKAGLILACYISCN